MHGVDFLRKDTPGNPASTHDRLYNDANGTLYFRDSNGVQNQVSPSAGGGFASFILSDGSNTQTINDSNTMTLSGGVAINGTVTATDTFTANWDLTKLSSANGTLTNSDYLGIYDLSGVAHRRVALTDLPTITTIDSANDLFPVLDATDSRLKMVAGDNLPGGGGGIAQEITQHANLGSNASTTSTNYVDVDAEFSISITTSGGNVFATSVFIGVKNVAGTGSFRLVLNDGSSDIAPDADGDTGASEVTISGNSTSRGMSVAGVWTSLAADTYTLRLQFKSSDANTCVISANYNGVTTIRENS